MKSQKLNNRPPRPYAKTSSSQSWSGGGFIPQSSKPKPVLLPKKAGGKGALAADANSGSQAGDAPAAPPEKKPEA